MAVDDLATAILAQQGGGPALPMGYRSGLIMSFDQTTFANVVQVDGEQMTNLRVLGVADAITYTPGAVVGLVTVGGKGPVSYAIVGRFVEPGSDAVTDALSALGSRFHRDFVDDFDTLSSTSYTDLSPDGPEVDVTIGPSGRALVFITTELAVTTAGNGALMSYAVSGATTRAANDDWAVAYSPTDTGVVMFSRASLQTGLTPGVNTFKAKYRSVTTGSTVAYQNREIIVWAI